MPIDDVERNMVHRKEKKKRGAAGRMLWEMETRMRYVYLYYVCVRGSSEPRDAILLRTIIKISM